MKSSNRKGSILFVFITLALDAIGLGIVIPVLPDVVRRFTSDEMTVSWMYGLFIAAYALLQFISSPFLGALSDRFGRRPVLLCSLFGAGADYIFMAYANTLPLLFLGRVISGVSGASYTVAGAYIADISDDSNRSKNFGILGAGFGLGFIVGPAIGGLLASYGPVFPFLAAAGFNLLNFAFGYFVLPESLMPEKRRPFNMRAINPFNSLKTLMSMPKIAPLLGVMALMTLAGQTHPSIWALYTEHRLGWTAAEVGVSLTVVGLLSALCQGGLTGILVKRFGERKILTVGAFGQAVTFALFAFASTGAAFYAVLIAGSIFWTSQPALQSLITREIDADKQGQLQGGLMSIVSIAAIINPIVMTALFARTSQRSLGFYFPGSPYLLASLFLFVAWVVVLRWSRGSTSTYSPLSPPTSSPSPKD